MILWNRCLLQQSSTINISFCHSHWFGIMKVKDGYLLTICPAIKIFLVAQIWYQAMSVSTFRNFLYELLQVFNCCCVSMLLFVKWTESHCIYPLYGMNCFLEWVHIALALIRWVLWPLCSLNNNKNGCSSTTGKGKGWGWEQITLLATRNWFLSVTNYNMKRKIKSIVLRQ